MSNFRFANYDNNGMGIDDPNDPGVKLDATGNPTKTTTGAPISVVGSVSRSAYLGQVASRCLMPVATLAPGSGTWTSGRTLHFTAVPIFNPIFVFPSWWLANTNVETNVAGGSCKSAIEISLGVRSYQNLEGDSAFINGYAINTFSGVIIPAGFYWIDHLQRGPNGVVYIGAQGQGYSPARGEGWAFGTGVPTDYTLAGTPPASFNNSQGYGPILILGQTTRPSFLISGNSRAVGLADFFSDASGDQGDFPRLIGQTYGYTNIAIGGSRLSTFNAASKIFRNQIINGTIAGINTGVPYHSHYVGYDLINDLSGGDTAVAAVARIVTQAASIGAGQKYVAVTTAPLTTSTDNWVSIGNQAAAQPTLQVNNAIRAGLVGVSIIADMADIVDPYRTGKWPVDINPNTATLAGATFTGVITNNVLTVSAITGTLQPGATIFGAGVSGDTQLMPFGTNASTGIGGNGTYAINQLQNVGSVAMSSGALITADGTHGSRIQNELGKQRSGPMLALIS